MTLRCTVYVWGLLLLAPQLRPQQINTLGTGRYGAEVRVGSDGNRNVECAVGFKPHSTFKLRSIAVPLSVATAAGALTLELAADAGAPGTLIESFSIKDVRTTEPKIFTVTSTTHPRLDAFTQYWIVIRAIGSTQIRWWNTVDSWSKDSWSATLRPEARRENGGPWSVIYSPDTPGIVVFGEPSKTVAVVFGPK